jgi:hypothetical protein
MIAQRVSSVPHLAEQAVIARRVGIARVEHRHLPVEADGRPETSGLLAATQARLTACRVAKLSLQSSTTSARATSGAARRAPREGTVSMRTSGLTAASRDFAASTLRRRRPRWRTGSAAAGS